MATIASWGEKTWTVSSAKVLALEDLAFSYAQVADNNTATEDKRTTNERGTELFPLTFSTVLHSGAGVDVRAEIEEWEGLITKVNYFYLGGKRLGPLMQLRKVSVSGIKLDDLGRMRLATLSFEFKEYDSDTTSVKVDWSAVQIKADDESKNTKKEENVQIEQADVQGIKVGCRVKPTGAKYCTGQTIPQWVKERSHEVSRITGNQLLLGYPSGICSWVYANEVTLV